MMVAAHLTPYGVGVDVVSKELERISVSIEGVTM